MRVALFAAATVSVGSVAMGAVIPISTLNTATPAAYQYTQNFDALSTTVTSTNSAAFVDDVTLPNWVAGIRPGAASGTPAVAISPTLNIAQGSGSSNTGRLYSFGTTTTSADRSLGSLPSDGSTGTSGATNLGFYYGVRFVNDTANTLTIAQIEYTGEEYRASYNAVSTTDPTPDPRNNQIVPAFKVVAAGGPATQLTDTGYTIFSGATFNTPVDGPTTGTSSLVLDGNLAANRVVGLEGEETLVLAPGDEIWVRFFDASSSGADHAIGIDDLTLTFLVPEPASLSLLAGLTMAMRRRRCH